MLCFGLHLKKGDNASHEQESAANFWASSHMLLFFLGWGSQGREITGWGGKNCLWRGTQAGGRKQQTCTATRQACSKSRGDLWSAEGNTWWQFVHPSSLFTNISTMFHTSNKKLPLHPTLFRSEFNANQGIGQCVSPLQLIWIQQQQGSMSFRQHRLSAECPKFSHMPLA